MNVVITGASTGIGEACARFFATHGHHLHLSARNEHKLRNLKIYLNEHTQSKVFIYATDLSIKKNVKLMAEDIMQSFGSIDVLINNVGQFLPNQIINSEVELLEKLMNINVYSAYVLTQKLLPLMLAQKSKSFIFNICSVASLQGYPNGSAYGISKYAMLGFSDQLRAELKNTNVAVSAVCPGATMSQSWQGVSIEEGRLMEAEDIAKIIFFTTQLSKQAVVEKIVLRPQKGDL